MLKSLKFAKWLIPCDTGITDSRLWAEHMPSPWENQTIASGLNKFVSCCILCNDFYQFFTFALHVRARYHFNPRGLSDTTLIDQVKHVWFWSFFSYQHHSCCEVNYYSTERKNSFSGNPMQNAQFSWPVAQILIGAWKPWLTKMSLQNLAIVPHIVYTKLLMRDRKIILFPEN